MTDDLTELGKRTWSFLFADGSTPESHDWYIILRLENGFTCPVTKRGELWKIDGESLYLQVGLFENNYQGTAFTSDGKLFGNTHFVADHPEMDWVRVVDYEPIVSDVYDADIHNSWKPGESKLPSDIERVESPIEKTFLNAAKSFGVKLVPQVKVGKYRADFQVEGTKIIIELDGHSYHASREQRRADALRDRKLTQKGFTVIRFTSDEIFENPNECIRQVIELLENKEGT